MNTLDILGLIDRKVYYDVKGMQFPVMIHNVKKTFGRTLYQIGPYGSTETPRHNRAWVLLYQLADINRIPFTPQYAGGRG